MFHHTRLKLTAWYLLIIMVVSIFFSLGFYYLATREIRMVIHHLEFRQQFPQRPIPRRFASTTNLSTSSLEALQAAKQQLQLILLLINLGILAFAGTAGYFLAGRTLKPIQEMINDQDTFITNASHEFRTPLANLQAELESQLMEKRISDKQARQLITSNLEEITILKSLSNRLISLASTNYSNHEKHFPISLTIIIQAAQKQVKALAKQKSIKLNFKITDTTILADQENLTEALVILLDNAIKYSPKKSRIDVVSTANSKIVTLTITDQGPGIPAADLSHIFDRFYRADSSRSQSQGFGLGLSIAQQIIHQHHGTIYLKNNANSGLTVTIKLPIFAS